MAGRRQDLETHLIAKDDASKVIGKVADELDDLEKRDTSIELTAEDKASPEIKSLSQLLAGLSDEDKTIVLNGKVGDAERNIDRILRSLRDVEKMDQQEIDVRVEMLGDARAELDRVHDELRQLDGETATVHVESEGFAEIFDQIDSLPGRFGEAVGGISRIGASLGTGGAIGVGVAGIVAGLAAATTEAKNLAIEAQTMAKLTGSSVEEASKLQQIWKTTGADVNDLNDIVVQLNGALQQSPEIAQRLGINLEDGLDPVQRLVQILDLADQGLVSMTDQSALFGEEGIRQVAALTSRYDDLGRTIEDMPPPISEEDAANALELDKVMQELQTTVNQLVLSIGEELVPLVNDLAGPLIKAIELYKDIRSTDEKASDKSWMQQFGELAFSQGPEVVKRFLHDVDRLQDQLGEGVEGAWNPEPIRAYNDAVNDAGKRHKNVRSKMAQDAKAHAAEEGKVSGELVAHQRAAAMAIELQGVASETAAAQAEEHAAALQAQADEFVRIAETEGAMRDLADTFSQIGIKGKALGAIFDLQNAPIDAEAAVRDIELAIDDLSTAAEGIDLSEGLDPSNVKADALLDAIDSLRPQIQQKVTDAFSAGGPAAARNMAMKYIIEVAEQLGISQVDAAELLGMSDVEALIHVAVEQTSLANAQSQLAILTGLSGETPLTASIALALETGEITPEQAQILAQDQLGDLGVDIPAALKVKTTKRELKEAYKAVGIDPDTPIGQPLKVVPTGLNAAYTQIEDGPGGLGWPTIEVPVQPVLAGTSTPIPYTPGVGFGPHSVEPAGLSAMTTAAGVIPMSGPTLPTLMVPVSAAPRAAQQPIIQNITLQAGVIGAPFDVARAVEEAMRRTARLQPVRP